MRTLDRLPALPLGVAGASLMALGSFGAGATRNRNGILDALGIPFLAYGHARGLLDVCLTVGVALLVVAWLSTGRGVVLGQWRLHRIRTCLWSWIAPLLFATPLMSRDVYSYLMQGAMVRDGFDPYSEGAAVNPGPYLLEVSHDWRNTTTPYGPLHLWVGNGVTSLVGENVAAGLIVYKLISVAGFAAIAWAIPRIADRLDGDPALALWLGVANPVMIIHLVGGMHNEAVMVGLVSVGILACLHRRFMSGIAVIGVAVALKATAAIALPFVAWMMVNHYSPRRPGEPLTARRVGAFAASGALVVSISVAVVAIITWASGTSWGWLAEISGNSKVVNPLSGATLLADAIAPLIQLFDEQFAYNSALSSARMIGSVLMLVGLVAVWAVFRQSDRRAVIGTTLAYQVAFLFNAVTLPWYFASSLSLVGTFTPPRWLIRLAVGASVVVGLSFTGSGNHRFYDAWWMMLAAILGFAAAYAVVPREGSSSGNDARTPSLEPAESPRGRRDHAARQPDVPAKTHPA